MNADSRCSRLHRWRTWLFVAALVWLLVAVYMLLPHFGMAQGITEANGRRIVAGMTRPEVESVLGTPNPLPDLARKGKSFWDNNAVLGFRYVEIHVDYDSNGQVVDSRESGHWRRPLWAFW